jgi:hypothetical protein
MYNGAPSSFKLDASPSMLWGNLSSCPRSGMLAFAHVNSAIVCASTQEAATSSSDASGRTWRLPPAPALGSALRTPSPVAQVAWVDLAAAGPLLAVCTHAEVSLFTGGDAPEWRPRAAAWACALATLPAGDAPPGGAEALAAHFFRGAAALPARNLLLVGTSWGDALAWHVQRDGATLSVKPCGALRGAHTAPITSIAADNECVCALRAPRAHAPLASTPA